MSTLILTVTANESEQLSMTDIVIGPAGGAAASNDCVNPAMEKASKSRRRKQTSGVATTHSDEQLLDNCQWLTAKTIEKCNREAQQLYQK